MVSSRTAGKVFQIPPPGMYQVVTFERVDGSAGRAELVHEGLMKGLWQCDKGGYYTWPELLVRFEPMRGVRR
jgi:hypothetical protein